VAGHHEGGVTASRQEQGAEVFISGQEEILGAIVALFVLW